MIKRSMQSIIQGALIDFPVVLITGPRQVGKSTLVHTFVESLSFKYVSLDNIDQRRLAQEDPRYFIEVHGYPLIIDEVQYAPELLEVITEIINERRIFEEVSRGLFILTGSQAFHLMQGVSQSMAGRAAMFEMEPLSRCEINQVTETPFLPNVELMKHHCDPIPVANVFEQIIRGFYPELYKNPRLNPEQYYARYVATYIDRDVTELINVKDKNKFHAFMQILASLTGQQLNVLSISKSIGVHSATINSWLFTLESSGIIYLLQPYHDVSMVKRIVRSPKLYFSDTGLAAHLLRIMDAKTLEVSHFAGAFMETFAMNEVRKSYLNSGRSFNGYYYRDSNQNEIDLILIENAHYHCIDIKKGMKFTKADVSAFNQLRNSQFKAGQHCILCNTVESYAIDDSVIALSIDCVGRSSV